MFAPTKHFFRLILDTLNLLCNPVACICLSSLFFQNSCAWSQLPSFARLHKIDTASVWTYCLSPLSWLSELLSKKNWYNTYRDYGVYSLPRVSTWDISQQILAKLMWSCGSYEIRKSVFYLGLSFREEHKQSTIVLQRTRFWAALGALFQVISSACSSASAFRTFLDVPFSSCPGGSR